MFRPNESQAQRERASGAVPSALRRIGGVLHEIPASHRADMRVPVRVIADETLLAQISRDRSIEQLINVATLPGIVHAAVGLPDMHEGYGFPVGGVAATLVPDGVISPGGIGFDINCGVRLLRSSVVASELGARLPALVHELSRSIPSGYGRHGRLDLTDDEIDCVLEQGCPYLVRARGLGVEGDLERIEAGGCLQGAEAAQVSERAKQRGHDQLGTLGGGNHFLEVQRVDEIYDAKTAHVLGLWPGQLTVLIHTGSRGLGHQVCTDYVRVMDETLARYQIVLPDRQLACAPLSSLQGKAYFAAMCAAANFAWANRQLLTQRTREVFARILGPTAGAELSVIYDVAHNIAKLERYGDELLCVHRKGATRAFGPSSEDVPAVYRDVGQPVFIPGSMGTSSFVMVGTDLSREVSFGSACHGAGRVMSRAASKRHVVGHELRRELEARGIAVSCPSNAELAEEAPTAYKDVDRVVDTIARAGIAKKVARLRPLGVLKG